MDLGIKGHAAIVVGGAKGIGRAIVDAFLAEGCQAGVVDLEGSGGLSGKADVRDFGQLTEAVDALVAEMGGLDHAVFAAGMGSGKVGFPFWNVPAEDWADVLQVNLVGAVNFAYACVPHMTGKGEGSMLFLSSVAGQIGSQTDPPYSAAKAGLINFAKCAARDLAKEGIRVNALCPGMVQTDINRSVWTASQAKLPEAERQSYEEWGIEKNRKISPMGRWQTKEECAAMAVFLASSHARNITGQTLNVDGGQVMHS